MFMFGYASLEPASLRTSAMWLVMMFLNMMHFVRFHFITTTLIYEFTALLKFRTLYMLTCSDSFCIVLFKSKFIL